MATTVDTARLRALAETVRDEREAVCAALKRGENASYRNLTEARWSLEELATIDATLLALLDELDTLRAGVA
jgi:ABC-type transporter Mla MlaB component